jgi:hypothetical protein
MWDDHVAANPDAAVAGHGAWAFSPDMPVVCEELVRVWPADGAVR